MSENFSAYMPGDSNLIAGQIRPIFQSDDLPHGQIREIKQFRWAVCIEPKVHSIRAPHTMDGFFGIENGQVDGRVSPRYLYQCEKPNPAPS